MSKSELYELLAYLDLEQYEKVVFEIEKKDKEIESLKADLYEANDSVTWWQNRFNSEHKEVERLKEEYMILQNASDKVEEEKDREIERLNNIINSIDTRLIEMGVDDEMLDVCEMYDVNGIELRKMIKELKGVDKE